MEILLNPVLVSVVVLCVLCLMKLNVLMALVLAAMTGAVMADIPLKDAMGILCNGFNANAGTALAYIFLGTFVVAVSSSGLADMMSRKLSVIMGKSTVKLLLLLAGISCLSQNLVPVHIAFIPIMIPPMLTMFNHLKLDRRGAACALAFGLKAPYICVPFGFGAIFMNIIASNLSANGMETTIGDVTRCNWILGLAMFGGMMVAVLFTYRRPREYRDLTVEQENQELQEESHEGVTVAAIFNGMLPLLTSITSFMITFSTYTPINDTRMKYEKARIEMQNNLMDVERALAEADPEHFDRLFARETSKYQAEKDLLRKENAYLKELARAILERQMTTEEENDEIARNGKKILTEQGFIEQL